eukprot:1340592-Amphidinium_carterae.1
MMIPEVRYWMAGGAYITPTGQNTPTLQQYEDRLPILEDLATAEEERRNRLRTLAQIVQGQEEEHRRSERRAREQEDLERQAATAEVPKEQVAQLQEQIPIIGASTEVQTVASSTSTVSSSRSTGASTRLERQERQDSADYWENITDIMYEYFHDENDIGESQSLHGGVLYWMTLDDIKDLER